ncbi:sulfotransferase domain-containing protein [Aquisalimonas sp. 2447]|uniref:sulfotransferase domain-containing protein n=1 Tax=Aquisalimonas sp. 2447 TaxID=2740807 RepID=UPI00143249FE|nr:sulfotransferase domain-containing protein [Aquisalimonas sp. 2447]QIT56549.1 sulfotransferase domain-containing protein [Aquisalimonas sp. 2447]
MLSPSEIIQRAHAWRKRRFVYRIEEKINKDPLNHYLILSDPRGGSTWLAEIINLITGAPIIWEPLHIKNNPNFRDLGFGIREYIPEDQKWKECEKEFEMLFKGKTLNTWTLKHASPKAITLSDRFLFKFCRGNSLLPWLTTNFSFRLKPVHLLRHPFAVISSQLKQGGWDQGFEDFSIPTGHNRYIYTKHKTFLDSLQTREETLTALWCISNSVPLYKNKRNHEWITIFYEDLVINPRSQIETIFRHWGLDMPEFNFEFNKNSRTSLKDTPQSPEMRIGRWKQEIDAWKIERMQKVLHYFGFDLYAWHTPYPRKIVD